MITLPEQFEKFQENLQDLSELEPENFVFEVPLYNPVKAANANLFRSLFLEGATKIDGYCYECKRESVFHSNGLTSEDQKPKHAHEYSGIRAINLACQRNRTHIISIIIKANLFSFIDNSGRRPVEKLAGHVIKIGQIPSHADIANSGLKKFNAILKGKDKNGFIRANGLAANGVYIGAFV